MLEWIILVRFRFRRIVNCLLRCWTQPVKPKSFLRPHNFTRMKTIRMISNRYRIFRRFIFVTLRNSWIYRYYPLKYLEYGCRIPYIYRSSRFYTNPYFSNSRRSKWRLDITICWFFYWQSDYMSYKLVVVVVCSRRIFFVDRRYIMYCLST